MSMFLLDRRHFFGALALATLWSRSAAATLVRGLRLPELARESQSILVVTALESRSHWIELGGSRCIVTDTRLRTEEVLGQHAPGGEIEVRTLGGAVGRAAEIVHGEAAFSLASPSVAFLRRGPDEMHYVTGMAQGHFPLRAGRDSALYLYASPRVPEMLAERDSAVRRLAGQRLGQARAIIREVLKP
jgi:hypothetical protein